VVDLSAFAVALIVDPVMRQALPRPVGTGGGKHLSRARVRAHIDRVFALPTWLGRYGRRVALIAVVMPMIACTSSKENLVPSSSMPSTGVPGDMLCGFVSKGPIEAAAGTTEYATSGSISGSRTGRTAACTIRLAGTDDRALEVFLGAALHNAIGPDASYIRYELQQHRGRLYIYPSGQRVGWAHPKYESIVDGKNDGCPDVRRLAAPSYG
jgi:hypothetical protein